MKSLAKHGGNNIEYLRLLRLSYEVSIVSCFCGGVALDEVFYVYFSRLIDSFFFQILAMNYSFFDICCCNLSLIDFQVLSSDINSAFSYRTPKSHNSMPYSNVHRASHLLIFSAFLQLLPVQHISRLNTHPELHQVCADPNHI